jgi:hypothetical protein
MSRLYLKSLFGDKSWILGSIVAFAQRAEGAPITPGTPVVAALNIQQQLYQALALAALSLLAILHQSLVSTGFEIGTFRGTDVTMGGSICIGTTIWYVSILVSGWTSDGQPCQQGWTLCTARLSYAPNILLVVTLLWVRSLWEVRKLSIQRKPAFLFQIWRPEAEDGQFAWSDSFANWTKLAVMFLVSAMVGLFSSGSFRSQEYLVAVLNIVGVTLFITQTGGRNVYNKAVQRYRGLVRVAIGTDQVAGTTYVFSATIPGISAVYGPCIEEEHQLVNEKTLAWLRNLRTQRSDPVEAGQILRSIATDLHRRTTLSKSQLRMLASWFYAIEPANDIKKSPDATVESANDTAEPTNNTKNPANDMGEPANEMIEMNKLSNDTNQQVKPVKNTINPANVICQTRKFDVAPESSAIGRESVYALYHLEFLLFRRRAELDDREKELIWQWRNPAHTGAAGPGTIKLIGSAGGLEGLKEALDRVGYLLETSKRSIPRVEPPNESVLGKRSEAYNTIDEYAGALWDRCHKGSESVPLSLYLFLALWQTELGSNAGFHPIPLRAVKGSHDGDLVMWGVLWRQGWYIAILAQATGLISAVVGALIAGILQ